MFSPGPKGKIKKMDRGELVSAVAGKTPISYFNAVNEHRAYWGNRVMRQAETIVKGTTHDIEPAYPGVARLYQTRKDFAGCMKRWKTYQNAAFEVFVNSNIKIILGEDCSRCLERVLANNGWTEIPNEYFIIAARGSGKSALLVCAIAAFMKNIPDYTAQIYSGIQNKGADMLNSVAAALKGMIARDTHKNDIKVKTTSASIEMTVNGNYRIVQMKSSYGWVSLLHHTRAHPSPLLPSLSPKNLHTGSFVSETTPFMACRVECHLFIKSRMSWTTRSR